VTDAWRCFVAVPLPDDLRGALAAAVGNWRRRTDTAGLRWTDPDAWHLTLAFLGAVPVADVPRVTAVLERVAATASGFLIEFGRVGAFPVPRRARVAWYGVSRPHERAAALAGALRQALAIDDDGAPFRAHVTLGRAVGHGSVDLRAWVRDADPPAGRLPVDRFELMRSHLGGGPARYERLASIHLPEAVRV